MSARQGNHESEIKVLLEPQEYQKLRRWIRRTGESRTRAFRNHFFDTPELFLRERRLGCRIRTFSDQAIFTVKGPARIPKGDTPGLSVREEIEEAIPSALARAVIGSRKPFGALESFSPWARLARDVPPEQLARIRPLGSLATRRTRARRQGFVLELDRCRCYDEEFFELEVETGEPERAEAFLRERLGELGIPLRPGKASKLQRFLGHWRRREK